MSHCFYTVSTALFTCISGHHFLHQFLISPALGSSGEEFGFGAGVRSDGTDVSENQFTRTGHPGVSKQIAGSPSKGFTYLVFKLGTKTSITETQERKKTIWHCFYDQVKAVKTDPDYGLCSANFKTL